MSYSVNCYLDGAIAHKKVQLIQSSGDSEAKRLLKETLETKVLPILLYLRFQNRTVKVSVERACTQREWNDGRVNPRFFKRGAIELNAYLDKVEQETAKLHERHVAQGISTQKEDLSGIIDECNNRTVQIERITFDKAFEEFIAVRSQIHAQNTIKTYRTTLNHLRAFSKNRKTVLRFESINAKFESDFRGYCLNDLGMVNNTIARNMQIVKTFMSFATEERKYNPKQNTEYQKFNSIEREKEVYALTLDELMHLFTFPFDKVHYREQRDVFCFMCFTGLRYSDVAKLRREDITERSINIMITKTRTQTEIPLNQYAKSILKQYEKGEKLLPVISNQKMNDVLHEIGEKAGLNTLVRVVAFKGATVRESYIPKFKVLTCHLGRKTFITNSLVLGMSERALKEIGAPKKQKSFDRYVTFVESVKQKAMDEAWNEATIRKARA